MEPNTTTMGSVFPGALSFLRKSISIYKDNYKSLFSLALVPFVTTLAYNISTQSLSFVGYSSFGIKLLMALVLIVLAIVSSVSQIIFPLSLMKTISKIDNGDRQFNLEGTYRDSLRLLFPTLWVGVLVLFSIVLPSIIFVIPGIVLALYLSFSTLILVLENKRGLNALSSSIYYVKNNFLQIVSKMFVISVTNFIFSLILLVIAALVLLLVSHIYDPILFLKVISKGNTDPTIVATKTLLSTLFSLISFGVLYPISITYSFLIYKHLKTLKPEPTPESDFKSSRVWLKTLSIIGLILSVLIIFTLPIVLVILSAMSTIRKERMHQIPQPLVQNYEVNNK